jgi:hypothetical protein
MGRTDPRVDAYIARSPDFAQPILAYLRGVVHSACPDVIETLKWGAPSFEYRGILCSFAAFRAHAVFGFRKGALITGDQDRSLEAMGSFGRLTSLGDLPSRRTLERYVRQAMVLNEKGVKAPPKHPRAPRGPLRTPAAFAAALRKHPRAAATFKAFSPSHRREYIEWVAEAKTSATRDRRIATAIEWLREGKPRNWKYVKR